MFDVPLPFYIDLPPAGIYIYIYLPLGLPPSFLYGPPVRDSFFFLLVTQLFFRAVNPRFVHERFIYSSTLCSLKLTDISPSIQPSRAVRQNTQLQMKASSLNESHVQFFIQGHRSFYQVLCFQLSSSGHLAVDVNPLCCGLQFVLLFFSQPCSNDGLTKRFNFFSRALMKCGRHHKHVFCREDFIRLFEK